MLTVLRISALEFSIQFLHNVVKNFFGPFLLPSQCNSWGPSDARSPRRKGARGFSRHLEELLAECNPVRRHGGWRPPAIDAIAIVPTFFAEPSPRLRKKSSRAF